MTDAGKMDIVPYARTDITIDLWATEISRYIQDFVQYWSDMCEFGKYPPRLDRGEWDEQFAAFMEEARNELASRI
jgi:hypothetical protein